jgi:hypothetical protein
MRRSTKNISLYDFSPELVKEWHPTANDNLTPMTVTIVYSKKVWWICSESHEWQASVKKRIKGEPCPICVQEQNKSALLEAEKFSNTKIHIKTGHVALQTLFAAFESDPANDNLGHDFRKSRRYITRANAVIESQISGHWFYADVKNFSAGGLCFEAAAPVQSGTPISIKLDRPLFTSDRRHYNSIVRWCKNLDNEDNKFTAYAIGAKYI